MIGKATLDQGRIQKLEIYIKESKRSSFQDGIEGFLLDKNYPGRQGRIIVKKDSPAFKEAEHTRGELGKNILKLEELKDTEIDNLEVEINFYTEDDVPDQVQIMRNFVLNQDLLSENHYPPA